MAWANFSRHFRKPSRVLGFLLFGVLIATFILIFWQKSGKILFCWPAPPPAIKAEQWPVILAAIAAIVGWLTTSIVTIRNSVKQHTINTLLQSRLSATYIEHVKSVNKNFYTNDGKIICLTEEEMLNPPAEINLFSLGYILNYFEFIAVGVRSYDLDERLMKSTLRGILCSVVAVSNVWIQERQKAQKKSKRPAVFENLLWLNNRWDVPSLRSEQTTRPKAPGNA